MRKVFISYHHARDREYKDRLVAFGKKHSLFIDKSVDTGDISESLDPETIRKRIRDQYLRDSTVTILLAGTETRQRKHVDWEIFSSMYDGRRNKKSGILVINLPSTDSDCIHAPHGREEKRLYRNVPLCPPVKSRAAYARRYPCLPDRVLDNLVAPRALVSVTPWNRIINARRRSESLIELAFRDRSVCRYSLSRPMRQRNS